MTNGRSERAPLLLVAVQDSGFRRLKRVNFSSALPDFLDRLGFQGWEVEPLERLDERELAGRALVVVAFAPEELWTPKVVMALADFDGVLLLEGPLPEAAALELAGVRTGVTLDQFAGRVSAGEQSDVDGTDPLVARLFHELSLEWPITLSPLSNRLSFCEAEPGPDPRMSGPEWQPALRYLANAAQSVGTPGSFHVHFRNVLLGYTLLIQGMLLYLDLDLAPAPMLGEFHWGFEDSVRLLSHLGRVRARGEQQMNPEELVSVMSDRTGLFAIEDINFSAMDSLALEVMELLAAAVELASRAEPDAIERYHALIEAARPLGAPLAGGDLSTVSWALEGSPSPGEGRRQIALPAPRLAAMRLWSDLIGSPAAILEPPANGISAPTTAEEARWLKHLAILGRERNLSLAGAIASAGEDLLALLQGRRLPPEAATATALTAQALSLIGAQELAHRLIEHASTEMCDPMSGLLRDETVRMGPEVGLSLLTSLRMGKPGSDHPTVPADDSPFEAWRRGLGPIQHWMPVQPGAEVLLLASPDEEPQGADWPLLVRHGRRLALSFPLLSWAVAECAFPPPPPGQRYLIFQSLPDAFTLAAGLLEELWLAAGRPRPLVWPWPFRMAASLRHDVDRIPTTATLAPILEGEARHRQAATYCFIPGRFATPLRELLEDLGHEVAVHGPDVELMAEDVAAIQAWAGTPVVGWTAHGDPAGTSSRGSLGWLAAEESGLAYADYSGRISSGFPHPPVAVDPAAGSARVLGIDVFDIDVGLDNYLGDGVLAVDRQLDILVDRCLRRGDHCCLNNHPDLGGERHAAMVGHVAARLGEAAWWTNLGEVARRRIAVQGVRMTLAPSGDVELTSAHHVPALQVVLPGPPGELPCLLGEDDQPAARLPAGQEDGVFALNARPGEAMRIVWIDEEVAMRLAELRLDAPQPLHRPVAPQEITRRLEEGGIRLPSETPFMSVSRPLLQAGLDHDDLLTSRQGTAIESLLETAYGFSLTGSSVADVGGAVEIGLWLLTEGKAADLALYEADPERLRRIRDVLTQLGIRGVTSLPLAAQTLDLPEGRFDLALLSGAPRRGESAPSFAAVARALRPGGVLLFKVANRWAATNQLSGAARLASTMDEQVTRHRDQLDALADELPARAGLNASPSLQRLSRQLIRAYVGDRALIEATQLIEVAADPDDGIETFRDRIVHGLALAVEARLLDASATVLGSPMDAHPGGLLDVLDRAYALVRDS